MRFHHRRLLVSPQPARASAPTANPHLLPTRHCSSEALQLQRLCSRNTFTPEEASSRIRSQAPLASKLVYADYVIDNSGPLPDLTAQVDRVIQKLSERAGWSWVIDWLVPPWGLFRGAALVAWRLWVKGVGKERRPGNKTRGERKGDDIELRDRSSRSGSRARL